MMKKKLNKKDFIKLSLIYLANRDDYDNDSDYNDALRHEREERRREIDLDPRYDIYRPDPRYNDVFTPDNYWQAHPDDPRNPYRQDYEYYEEDEYNNQADKQVVSDQNLNETEIDKNVDENKSDENTDKKVETNKKTDEDNKTEENKPVQIDSNENTNQTTSSNSSSDDGLGGSLCIFCVAVVLIVGVLSIAPWLLIIIIPVVLYLILKK